MASLRRFKDTPYWFACFTGPDGARLQRSTKQTDRRKAQKVADQYAAAAKRARAGLLTERQARKVIAEIYGIANKEQLQSDSIAEFFSRWIERAKREVRANTASYYALAVKRLVEWLGPRARLGISHLASSDLVKFRDHLARKQSPSSVNLALASIQAALGRAFNDGLVDVNEAQRVPRLVDNSESKQRRRAFSEAELRTLLSVADTEWRGMILAGVYCGARLGDIASLRWENVDLASHELRFSVEKTRRSQSIPIAEPLLRYFLEVASTDDASAPLFPRAFELVQRNRRSMLSKQFHVLMEKAGIAPPWRSPGQGRHARRVFGELTFHSLRHFCTTALKQAGATDSTAREIVGHASAAVSRIYSHIDAATLRAAIERLPDITA